ncbi:NUDIX domain-containing protein [Parvibium lacunae]
MSIWKPSVTVAAIIEDAGKFLLVEEETSDGLRFNQPAGHLDEGETPVHGAIREALEETAHHFQPQGFLGLYMSRYISARTHDVVTYLRIAFYGKSLGADLTRALDTGIVRAVWLTPEEIQALAPRHRSPLVWQCIEDYLNGRRAPLEQVFAHESIVGKPLN